MAFYVYKCKIKYKKRISWTVGIPTDSTLQWKYFLIKNKKI